MSEVIRERRDSLISTARFFVESLGENCVQVAEAQARRFNLDKAPNRVGGGLTAFRRRVALRDE